MIVNPQEGYMSKGVEKIEALKESLKKLTIKFWS